MQPEVFLINHENMSCIYDLSWNKKIPAIILKIHKSFIENFPNFYSSRIVPYFMKEFGFRFFDQFRKNLLGDLYFGFDQCCRKIGEENNFWIFEIPIPVIEEWLNESCDECKGFGKDKHEEKCLYCNGTGREKVFKTKRAYAICASLCLLFELAPQRWEKKFKTDCDFPQLLILETSIQKNIQHGGTFGGIYSVPLVKFLASFEPNTEICEMINAMTSAHKKMFGKFDSFNKCYTWAKVAYKHGWLNVSCYGDACGLHPANSFVSENECGYRFDCHNVDTPMQQIILISGLAALCDKARKEIKSY